MDLQFKFNGTIVNHPDNWREFEAIIERSDDLLGLVNKYTSELTFSGDAYDAIVTSITTNGFCEPVVTLVQIRTSQNAAWIDLIEGTIFPTECDFDRTKCTIRAAINDNSYISKIQNNQKIKAHIEVPRSKNDVTITAALEKRSDFFTPSTGAYDYPNRRTFSIDETLRFLVDFMTDGTVDYISDTFGTGGDYEFWRIATGKELRAGPQASYPYVSFYDVISELNKKAPIGFGIEDNGGTPRIRIEKKEYFRDESVTAFTARSIRGLQMTFRESEIYSKVRFGGTNTQVEDGVYQWPDIPFFNFKEEEYHLLGECNIENELNLVGDWIVDSNVIEDILINANDEYDEDIVLFISEFDNPEYPAVDYGVFDFTLTGERVYNRPFTNQEVAVNFLGFIPNSIAQFLGISGGGFTGFDANRQTLTSHTLNGGGPTYNEEPAEFNTVNYSDGNYTATPDYRYTAAGVGYFNMLTRLELDVTAVTLGSTLGISIMAKRFNSGNVLQETITTQQTVTTFGTHVFFNNFEMVFNSGDYVHIRYEFTLLVGTSITFDITTGSNFFSYYVVGLGGVVQEYDPGDYHIYDFTTEKYPMSLTDYLALYANPAGSFKLNTGSVAGEDIITFADRIVYRPFTGSADLKTFGKYNGF